MYAAFPNSGNLGLGALSLLSQHNWIAKICVPQCNSRIKTNKSKNKQRNKKRLKETKQIQTSHNWRVISYQDKCMTFHFILPLLHHCYRFFNWTFLHFSQMFSVSLTLPFLFLPDSTVSLLLLQHGPVWTMSTERQRMKNRTLWGCWAKQETTVL